MAPFAVEARIRYGSTSRGTRDGSKGGAFRSGRGGAKNGKPARAITARNAFYSTRVKEKPREGGDGGWEREKEKEEQQSESEDGQPTEDSKISSDSDNDGLPTAHIKPYSSLLKSLSANTQREEPQRKRRKLESPEAPIANEVLEEMVDESEEPESLEDLEVNSKDNLDEIDGTEDPYTLHFSNLDEASLRQSIQDLGTGKVYGSKSDKPEGWLTSYEGLSAWTRLDPIKEGSTLSSVRDLHLKQKLKDAGYESLQGLGDVEASIAAVAFHYKDVLFPQRTLENADMLRRLLCLHSLNHVYKTRDNVIKNNARLARNDAGEDLELRDQGFTRPKVLILLPTRHSCVRYVDTIGSLCEPEQQENKKRFHDSYANGEDVFSPDKPADFRELFAGNDDDMFRLGLKFTRKTVKYFSQFYNSDIIFASPLGLRMALGGDDLKKQDSDFLSSIEIVIVDQADAISMQNWEHVEHIFEHLNLQPKETHGCDFSRVKHWYLDGQAKYLRQTILLSAFNFPALNKMYTKSLLNIAGKIKYSKKVEGAIVEIELLSRQTFSRFDYKTPASEPDDRFKYFTTAIVPSLSRSHIESRKGILIFIPSYADFVRVRNYFASSLDTQNVSFGSISEYTSVQEVARARSHFLSGRHSVLLYTERAHHFRRYHLKGVKKVIMYALPENPIFYGEIVGGFLQSSVAATKTTAREASARALFSKLDILKLERTVGSNRHLSMVIDKGGDTFVFE